MLEAGETARPSDQLRREEKAINACPLWAKLSPQQRLRAQRIALPRDHAANEKIPAQTLGDRVAWILGTVLAALGGVLIAPMVALEATQLSLLIVSAYAAAIFGRLKSLPMTFVGAVVVGCMEAYMAGYLPQNDYLPGLRLAAPAILLLLALLLFPHGRLRGRDRNLSQVPVPTVRPICR